jgi:hypothetical protein
MEVWRGQMVRPRHRIGDRFIDPQEKAEDEEAAAASLSPRHVGLHDEHLDIPPRQHNATPNPQTDKSPDEEELNPIIAVEHHLYISSLKRSCKHILDGHHVAVSCSWSFSGDSRLLKEER